MGNSSKVSPKYSTILNVWISNIQNRVKHSTYICYDSIIRNRIIGQLGDYPIKNMTIEVIQKFIDSVCDSGFSEGYKTLVLNVLKQTLVNTKNFPEINILLKRYRFITTKEHNSIGDETINKLSSYCFNEVNKNTIVIGILLAIYCGLRIGEICSLKKDAINFEEETIKVNNTLQRIHQISLNKKTVIMTGTPKSLSSRRIIPLPKALLLLIQKIITEKGNYVVGNAISPIEPRKLRRYLGRIISKENLKAFKFHDLRHHFATKCIALGMDHKTVSQILGHSSISTTLNLYVHPKLEYKRHCIDLFFNTITKL